MFGTLNSYSEVQAPEYKDYDVTFLGIICDYGSDLEVIANYQGVELEYFLDSFDEANYELFALKNFIIDDDFRDCISKTFL